MTEVVFALKRDAKTDPPDHYNPVLVGYDEPKYSSRPDTDFLSYWEGRWGRWADIGFRPVAASQPLWWYDLRPTTEGEPLTTKHLKALAFPIVFSRETHDEGIARLRAALDVLH